MDQYRLIFAADIREVERQMNDAAGEGYRFVSIATGSGETAGFVVVMEYRSGGLAGTVESEALQSGIPSQGPTAERQWSEEALGTGRL